MKYRTILFDIDGTLLDSKELIFRGYETALLAHGHSVPRENLHHVLGLTLEEGYAKLFPEQPALHGSLVDTHTQHSRSNVHLITPFPRMEEVLAELKSKGLKLAAITNRRTGVGFGTFTNTSLDKFMDLIVSATDVTNPKPHPESLLLALNKFQLLPHEAMMVGDSHSDIQAGKAAGVTTVGVSYGMLGHSIKDHNPDHVIHTLLELLDLL